MCRTFPMRKRDFRGVPDMTGAAMYARIPPITDHSAEQLQGCRISDHTYISAGIPQLVGRTEMKPRGLLLRRSPEICLRMWGSILKLDGTRERAEEKGRSMLPCSGLGGTRCRRSSKSRMCQRRRAHTQTGRLWREGKKMRYSRVNVRGSIEITDLIPFPNFLLLAFSLFLPFSFRPTGRHGRRPAVCKCPRPLGLMESGNLVRLLG
jgi:hypothetical protein